MPASMLNDVLNALEDDFRDKVLAEIVSTVSRTADKRAIKEGIEVPGAKLITDKTTLGRE